jgi:TRAP-type mannitol/chloroaromatic compound transport system permease small subunit
MSVLQSFARGIDGLNEKIAKAAIWLVLIVTLETAVSALVLKVMDVGSNAFLEIRWYLFSAIFLLGAAYTLQKNAHVRIDVLSGRFSRRTQAAIDIFGTVFFLLPVSVMVVWMSWGVFWESFMSAEISSSAGGLVVWPARLLVPLGFGLLMLQGLSEVFKRIEFLRGAGPDPLELVKEASAEEALAEAIRRQRGEGAQ